MAVSLVAEAIDATLWIDTHEHLVEERRRLGPDPYVFTDVWDDRVCIAGDWTALLGHYAIDDLVSAGLPPAQAHEFVWGDGEPLAKWDAVESSLAAARNTGFLRAVDVTTERLFGLRLDRSTCEAIDAACRALRAPGWYARVLAEAGVERCQVNSLEDEPFCETEQPELLEQDIALYPLVAGTAPASERASGIEVADLDDYLDVVEWCFERFAHRAVAVKLAWAYFRSLAVSAPDAPPNRAFARLRRGAEDADDRRRVEDFLVHLRPDARGLAAAGATAVGRQAPAERRRGPVLGLVARTPLDADSATPRSPAAASQPPSTAWFATAGCLSTGRWSSSRG